VLGVMGYGLLLRGGWIPVVPSGLAVILGGVSVIIYPLIKSIRSQ
jgi:CHASE2 domain-containing sensor protein